MSDLPAEIASIYSKIEHDPIGARAEIDALLPQDPDNVALIECRILTMLRLNDMAGGIAAIQRVVSRHRTPNLYLWLGGALMHTGRPQAALMPLTEAAKWLPSLANLDVLARCQHRLGLLDAAIATLRQLIALPEQRLTPRYSAMRGLAYALRDARRYAEADTVIARLLARYAANPLRVAPMALHYDIGHPFPGWRCFLDKASLADTLAAYHRRHPAAPVFWPASFRLPRDRDRLVAWRAANPGAIIALKPNDLFGGQGISLTGGLPDSAAICVAQRYVDPPALLEGHKFHLRLTILITRPAPLRAYLWTDGVVRLAPAAYDAAQLGNLAAHITNTALHKDHAALLVSQDPDEDDVGHVRALGAVLRRLYPNAADRAQAWHKLHGLARDLVRCAADTGLFRAQSRRHTRWCFPPALFALDVVLDASGQPWLLEVQYNPAMTGSPLVNRLNGELFKAAFQLGVFPLDAGPAVLDSPARREALIAEREAERAGGFERLV